jgi:glycerate-2-kinase
MMARMEIAPSLVLKRIFSSALYSVEPYRRTRGHLDAIRFEYGQGNYEQLIIAGFGKAAFPMTRAVAEGLGDMISTGVAVTKQGHAGPWICDRIRFIEAEHPVAGEHSVYAALEITRLSRKCAEDFVLCLVSGGGSALMVSPAEGITLEEKQATVELLLRAGAPIEDLNAVRKHLSRVKGGRLAEIFYPARIAVLVLSDVIGDRLDVIASGPLYPDETTYADAISILARYGIADLVPQAVKAHLNMGEKGYISETPKVGNRVFDRITHHIVGSNSVAVQAACDEAAKLGFKPEILTCELGGEAGKAAAWLADKALGVKRKKGEDSNSEPVCLIAGGETTVTVRGAGKGGRNMEMALAFALAIEGQSGIAFLSAGTDGTDGPTDAAGAMVDGQTVSRSAAIGLDARDYLRRNDSYHYFQRTGGLFKTGPTGTNVMDLQLIVITS